MNEWKNPELDSDFEYLEHQITFSLAELAGY